MGFQARVNRIRGGTNMLSFPKKLNTRRSHRLIQFFLERSNNNWPKKDRDFSIYWSTSHMTTTAQIMRLLAVSRGLDADICAIAGAIHDIATMESGKTENHMTRSLDYIAPLIREYNESSYVTEETLKITESEIMLLEEIIPQHGRTPKDIVTENPYVETLKDADSIDRYLQGVEATESEMPRLIKVFSELGVNIEFI